MYLIDSNVFIEAKNRYYGFDIAPGFWVWLDRAHKQSLACSIEPVRDELIAGDDELAKWAADHADVFLDIDQKTTQQYPLLTGWASAQNFTKDAISEFAGNQADYQLIAYAKAHQYIVVTHERFNPQKRNRILIPNACQAMGVHYVDTFEMLRKTGAKLDLRP